MTDCFRTVRPADAFQIRRAQALCVHAPALQANLDAFLCSAPSYTQMEIYLKQLKATIATDVAAMLVGIAQRPRA